jgi:fructose-bisphosphate aldolase class II
MPKRKKVSRTAFKKALQVGRPPNIKRLFPGSGALIVSGKFIDRAMIAKGQCMTIAANARNYFVMRGALQAAQKANAAIMIEIAKSEGGASAYCADHYGIKNRKDLDKAKTEIPSMFDAGITSIAVDASHQPDAENLLANIEINPCIPAWAGLETEVGEIKGAEGLSTPEEALFLIQGLNAHGIFPDWIALNNGTTHGIEQTDSGIDVGLTAAIHRALEPYGVSGAQHGTSGNNSERLRAIARQTRTTKANVATALQMLSWGVEVNEFGNAILDSNSRFRKVESRGVSDELWSEMVAYADAKQLKAGDYKKLNLPFENKLLALPAGVRDRMAGEVEQFVYALLVDVFGAADTAPLVVENILRVNSHDPGPKVGRIEDPAGWTRDEILKRAAGLQSDKGRQGNFDD